MIQRIQSLYFLLAAIAAAVVPLPGAILGESTSSWFFPVLAVFAVLIAAGAIAAIVLYKQRALQRKLAIQLQYAVLVLLVFLVVGIGLGPGLSVLAGGLPAAWVAIGLGMASYVLLYLAKRGVQRDIDLVRSMDRLR